MLVQDIDLLCGIRTQLPWSSASSWPTRPVSDGGTGPGAYSHTACRTSWCRKDCSPDRIESKSPASNACSFTQAPDDFGYYSVSI